VNGPEVSLDNESWWNIIDVTNNQDFEAMWMNNSEISMISGCPSHGWKAGATSSGENVPMSTVCCSV